LSLKIIINLFFLYTVPFSFLTHCFFVFLKKKITLLLLKAYKFGVGTRARWGCQLKREAYI
jgi:hypothetical protein